MDSLTGKLRVDRCYSRDHGWRRDYEADGQLCAPQDAWQRHEWKVSQNSAPKLLSFSFYIQQLTRKRIGDYYVLLLITMILLVYCCCNLRIRRKVYVQLLYSTCVVCGTSYKYFTLHNRTVVPYPADRTFKSAICKLYVCSSVDCTMQRQFEVQRWASCDIFHGHKLFCGDPPQMFRQRTEVGRRFLWVRVVGTMELHVRLPNNAYDKSCSVVVNTTVLYPDRVSGA